MSCDRTFFLYIYIFFPRETSSSKGPASLLGKRKKILLRYFNVFGWSDAGDIGILKLVVVL